MIRGIVKENIIGRRNNLKIVKSKSTVNNPINIAVIIERVYVANTFSNRDLREKLPIMKSLDVLAMNGPLKLPLKDRRAGIISIKIRKLLKGRIKIESIKPAKISPIIDIISEGKVSLIIFPLESGSSIYHPHQNPLSLNYLFQAFFIIIYGLIIILLIKLFH